MNAKAWIEQIKDKTSFFVFFDILFLILSGIPVLFFFERQFFLSTDWIKLILLSGAITAPFFFLNTIALSSFEEDTRLEKKDGLFFAMTMAAMSTTVFLNGPLIAIYWQGATIKTYMLVVAGLEIILFGAAFLQEKMKGKKKSESKVVAKRPSKKKAPSA
jgi:hypothetical protein